jgi:hypothetical protein
MSKEGAIHALWKEPLKFNLVHRQPCCNCLNLLIAASPKTHHHINQQLLQHCKAAEEVCMWHCSQEKRAWKQQTELASISAPKRWNSCFKICRL